MIDRALGKVALFHAPAAIDDYRHAGKGCHPNIHTWLFQNTYSTRQWYIPSSGLSIRAEILYSVGQQKRIPGVLGRLANYG